MVIGIRPDQKHAKRSDRPKLAEALKVELDFISAQSFTPPEKRAAC